MLLVGKPSTRTDSFSMRLEELNMVSVIELLERAKLTHAQNNEWHEHILSIGDGDLFLTLEHSKAHLHATIHYSKTLESNPLINELFTACLIECDGCTKTLINPDLIANEA